MAKVVTCREVGVDCNFEARGETVEEVLLKCWEHGQAVHGMDTLPEELVTKLEAGVFDEKP